MLRTIGLAGAALLALSAPVGARAAEQKLPRDTRVVVVGPITSAPRGAVNEQKMQVAIGPDGADYTLHFRNARLFGLHGEKIDEDGLDDGMWVRAEGRVMKDPRRIEVSRVQVIAPDAPGHKRSAFYRSGFDQGYISRVAGSREEVPVEAMPSMSAPFVVVGRISDDTGPFSRTRRLQLQSRGFEWTLHVPKEAAVLDLAGKPVSVHEIHQGQWVRAYGWRNGDLRMRVERMENIGADEAYRASSLYRTDDPLGYVEAPEGAEVFVTTTLTGPITAIDRTLGTVSLRGPDGRERVFFSDNATITRDGRRMSLSGLRRGDTVTVETRSYRFER